MSQRKPFLAALTLAALAAASPASAKDLYKHFLDPGLPHHKAILQTLTALEADPKDAALLNDLGCLVAWDGFWRDALRILDESADLDKTTGRPLYNAGLVHVWKGEYASAKSKFEKAKKREPGNWAAWWMLGFAHEQLGDTEAAVEAYKVSMRVDTSLFDAAKNPYAAETRLKSRVLLETYEKRRTRAMMPETEQFASKERYTELFQRGPSAPRPPAPQPLPPGVESDVVLEPPPPPSGPVITRVAPQPQGGSASAPGATSSAPTWNSGRDGAPTKNEGPRAEGARRFPVVDTPSGKGLPPPPPAPTKPIVPGPGGGGD